MRDMTTYRDIVNQLEPGAVTASPADGADVDLANYDGATFLITIGTHTDGTFTFGFEEADDDGTGSPDTYADIAAADLIDEGDNLTSGEYVVSDATADGTTVLVGYRGDARFVRMTLTVTGSPTTGATLSGVAERGPDRHQLV